jgi:hypothetical protein
VRCGSQDHIQYKCTAKDNPLQVLRLAETEQELLKSDRDRMIQVLNEVLSPAQKEEARHAQFVALDNVDKLDKKNSEQQRMLSDLKNCALENEYLKQQCAGLLVH